jgi:peroxiredoxin
MSETLREGLRLPDARFLRAGPAGIEVVDLGPLLAGRRVVIFAVPGAFTPTCDAAHLPSFVRTADALRARGVGDILCISVNDPHVMRRWGETAGADAAGILMLADADAGFTRSVGMAFTAPESGFFDRSRRYAMLVEDGVVTLLNVEERRGTCELSAGETLLARLPATAA